MFAPPEVCFVELWFKEDDEDAFSEPPKAPMKPPPPPPPLGSSGPPLATELSADINCEAGAALTGVCVGFREDGRLPEGSVESLGRLGEEAREESGSKRLTTVGINGLAGGMAEGVAEQERKNHCQVRSREVGREKIIFSF